VAYLQRVLTNAGLALCFKNGKPRTVNRIGAILAQKIMQMFGFFIA
jgi:hypothetical protein